MKKLTLNAFLITVLAFYSCSSDDSKDELVNECETCSLEFLGESITGEFCDNGDGTVTSSYSGEEDEIVDLGGASFADYIATVKAVGYTCD